MGYQNILLTPEKMMDNPLLALTLSTKKTAGICMVCARKGMAAKSPI
jgi:hypothetical protein